jgi:hypothetical protein
VILLVALAVALVLALALGGSLSRLAEAHIRRSPLILLSLALQVLVFSRWWQVVLAASRGLTGALYLVSLGLLLHVVWLNWRLPGLALLALGLVANTAVIFANGGTMPAALSALQVAGIVDSQTAFEAMRTSNSSIIGSTTPLWFLGDIWAIPRPFPLANVYSPGDVLIGLGAIWFVVANTRPRQAPAS